MRRGRWLCAMALGVVLAGATGCGMTKVQSEPESLLNPETGMPRDPKYLIGGGVGISFTPPVSGTLYVYDAHGKRPVGTAEVAGDEKMNLTAENIGQGIDMKTAVLLYYFVPRPMVPATQPGGS